MVRRDGQAHDAKGGLERRLRLEWLWTVPALMLLAFLLSFFGVQVSIDRLDHHVYGRTLALATPKPSNDIVIIALDDDSIKQFGYWPWRRAVHAQLLSSLSKAKAVGLDLMLEDSNPAYPDDDQLLADAIAQHGRVALPLVVDQGRVRQPLPLLADAAATLGYINAYLDSDSAVRAMRSYMLTAQGQVDHFVLAMLDAGGDAQHAARLRRQDGKPLRIAYVGDPGSFTMYPYAKVLDGSVPVSAFEGKYVLVGAWATALGDVLPVPLSSSGEPMAGVEILANGLNSALGNYWIRTPDRLQSALISMLPVLLVCLALRRLSPRRSFFVMLITMALIFIANWLLMRYAQMWVAPSAALIGIMLAYPVWNWRLQEAVLKQVDAELDSLYAQNLMHGQTLSDQAQAPGGASLPGRMLRLHQGMSMLRHAIGLREEALHFLSHDMRSPQNAILALTQLQRHGASMEQAELLDRVDRSASRTLGLVDGFVRLARAESMALSFREVDLAEVLQNVCDERWAMAQRRGITLEADVTAGPAMVSADEDMLARALGNLVDNAIHYSPDGSRVWCSLHAQGAHWVAQVKDEGRGMTQEQQHRLFEPFRRFDVDAPNNPEGSGLGLALVRAVVLRHGGRVAVQSARGKGSAFRVSLRALGFDGLGRRWRRPERR